MIGKFFFNVGSSALCTQSTYRDSPRWSSARPVRGTVPVGLAQGAAPEDAGGITVAADPRNSGVISAMLDRSLVAAA